MPNRILRASLRQSRRWNSCSFFDQSFYIRLLTLVDDYGRYEAHPQLLANECFPYGDDKGLPVSCESIDRSLAVIREAGLAVIYENQGNHYIKLLRWKERVRTTSRFPEPSDSQMTVKCLSNGKQMIASPPSPSPSPSPAPCARQLPVNSVELPIPQSKVSDDSVMATGGNPSFDAFWKAYPKHVDVIDSQRAFVESGAHGCIGDILKALEWQVKLADWRKSEGRWIPKPADWLRDRCWLNHKPKPRVGVNPNI